jgi:hypothetical protein
VKSKPCKGLHHIFLAFSEKLNFTFWIGICQLFLYQKISKKFGGESCHQSSYFDILLNLLSLTKVSLGGAKDGHFSFF